MSEVPLYTIRMQGLKVCLRRTFWATPVLCQKLTEFNMNLQRYIAHKKAPFLRTLQ
jgi:hypothetical protein